VALEVRKGPVGCRHLKLSIEVGSLFQIDVELLAEVEVGVRFKALQKPDRNTVKGYVERLSARLKHKIQIS
jgi:hypothetical protein